ncbi:MAG: hypothetical protein IJ019_00785 [Alphaproteobacteria bacterium]|nr:hypothetical protein [Alphaproteobacteria bacterium]
MPDTKQEIDNVRKKIRHRRALRVAANLAGVTLGIAALAGPKMVVKHHQKEVEGEIKELADLSAQETKHKTTNYTPIRKGAKKFLEENGYSLNMSSETQNGAYYVDVIDQNNVSVGAAKVFCEDETHRIVELLVLNDSPLMTLMQMQPESGFKKLNDATISFREGERITEAMNRHRIQKSLKSKDVYLQEVITGTRTRSFGTY